MYLPSDFWTALSLNAAAYWEKILCELVMGYRLGTWLRARKLETSFWLVNPSRCFSDVNMGFGEEFNLSPSAVSE